MRNRDNNVLFCDFKEVKLVLLEEKLSKEEIEEGLEPISEMFKVCITSHAFNRMYKEQNRFCDYEWVESLLVQKSTSLLNCQMNEDILLLSDDKKMAVVLQLTNIEGELAIVLVTVIRNVIYKNGQEIELTNRSKKEGTIVI